MSQSDCRGSLIVRQSKLLASTMAIALCVMAEPACSGSDSSSVVVVHAQQPDPLLTSLNVRSSLADGQSRSFSVTPVPKDGRFALRLPRTAPGPLYVSIEGVAGAQNCLLQAGANSLTDIPAEAQLLDFDVPLVEKNGCRLDLAIQDAGSVRVQNTGKVCAEGLCSLRVIDEPTAVLVATPTAPNDRVTWIGTAGCTTASRCDISLLPTGRRTLTAVFSSSIAPTTNPCDSVTVRPFMPAPSISTNPAFSSVWGDSAQSLYVVGTLNGGVATALRFTGGSWTTLSLIQNTMPFMQNLVAVSGAGASVWMVGARGSAFFTQGSSAEDKSTGILNSFNSVWAFSQTQAIAVGAGAQIWKWDQATTKFTKVTGPASSTVTLQGIWGTAEDNYWVVGASGTIYKNEGGSWIDSVQPTSSAYRAIHGLPGGPIFVVGENSSVLTSDIAGASWQEVTPSPPAGKKLNGVWTDGTLTWAVGDSGTVLCLQKGATAWKSVSGADPTKNLSGVWGTGKKLWIVGVDKQIYEVAVP